MLDTDYTPTGFMAIRTKASQYWGAATISPDWENDSISSLPAAFDIWSTDEGLRSCGIRVPEIDEGPTCIVTELSTAWTLPSNVTQAHMDGFGDSQFLYHWKGRKMWIMWPATKKNLEILAYGKGMVGMPDLLSTQFAIENMEDIEVMMLDSTEGSTGWIIYPNTIHACLSFDESCHSGFTFRKVDDFSNAAPFIEWGLGILSADYSTTSERKAALQHLESIESTLSIWGTMEYPTIQAQISQWKPRVEQIRNFLIPAIEKAEHNKVSVTDQEKETVDNRSGEVDRRGKGNKRGGEKAGGSKKKQKK